jgi:hypothetical protein
MIKTALSSKKLNLAGIKASFQAVNNIFNKPAIFENYARKAELFANRSAKVKQKELTGVGKRLKLYE